MPPGSAIIAFCFASSYLALPYSTPNVILAYTRVLEKEASCQKRGKERPGANIDGGGDVIAAMSLGSYLCIMVPVPGKVFAVSFR